MLLDNLSTSTTYYYQVTSGDGSSNTATSTERYFTTLEDLSQESTVRLREELAQYEGYSLGATAVAGGGGGGGIDRTKPVISEVKVANIGSTEATVSWKTDKTTIYNFVDYGLGNDFNYSSGKVGGKPSVLLRKLDPSTTYLYRVGSIDEFGNLGTSPDATFTTLSSDGSAPKSPEEPKDSTPPPSDEVQSSNDDILLSTINKAAALLQSMAGQVSLNILETAITTQFNSIRQLSSMIPPPLLRGEPKVLSTSDTATVSWSTDKDSNSLVAISAEDKYDATKGDEAYLQVVGNPDEMTQAHIVNIYNLSPDTTYHYQVRSASDLGTLSKSSDFDFKTKTKELAIDNYTVESLSPQSAVFRWVTTDETDSQIKYTPYRNGSLAVAEAKNAKKDAFSTIHEMTLNNLSGGLTYEVTLSGKDTKGKVISKTISSFTAGEDKMPPSIYQVQTDSALSIGKDTSVQTIISWLTSEPATGQVYYRKGIGSKDDPNDSWQLSPKDQSYSQKHIVVITKFEPGQIYQFKIESADSSNNLSQSNVLTILAPKEKQSVFQVIMNNFEEVFGWTQRL